MNLTDVSNRSYIVDNERLWLAGYDGRKECYFFTRPTKEKNELVEIPFTFDGIIFKEEEKKVQ